MGDICSAIDDDYDDYVYFCNMHLEDPVGIVHNFYRHYNELKIKYNVPGYVKDTEDQLKNDRFTPQD